MHEYSNIIMTVCILPEYNYIIFGAISQGVSSTATDDTRAGVWRYPSLHKGAQVDQRATHIMHHDVIGSLQQGLQ